MLTEYHAPMAGAVDRGPARGIDDGVLLDDPLRSHLLRVDHLLSERVVALEEDWTGGQSETWCDDRDTCHDIGNDDPDNRCSAGLSASIDLAQLLNELISSGGKRIRPTLSFLGFWIAGGRPGSVAEQTVTRLGAALEMLHTFALVHDDVMDESASRRGHPTAHVRLAQEHLQASAQGEARRFGESMATLLGDLAHAEADALIAECPSEVRARWQMMIVELIRGQFSDLAGAADRSRDPGQALLIARLKSGGYTIQRPLELGATAAGARPELLELLSEFGREVGAAFALRDDMLGVWGDPRVTGKPAGDDLLSGKPTMIIALARNRLAPADRKLLDQTSSSSLEPEQIRTLQQAIRESGVAAEMEQMISHHVHRSFEILDQLSPGAPNEAYPDQAAAYDPAAALARITHQVAWRDR